MKKIFLLVLLCVPAAAQEGKLTANNDSPDGAVVVSREPASAGSPSPSDTRPPIPWTEVKPLRDELDAPDMKRVLTAQREKFFWTAEAQRFRAEMEADRARMNDAETQLALWNKEIDTLLMHLQARYNCPGCTLQSDMKWKAPAPPVVAPKPAPSAAE